MNAFVNGLGASSVNPKNTTGSDNPKVNGSTTDNGSPAQPNQSASPTTGLAAILVADGLAQELGVDPSTGKMTKAGDWQHILLLKALESGGSITKTSNILGSRVRYSGGAVGTFALLTRDGILECSGNVFDFGGSVVSEAFRARPAPLYARHLLAIGLSARRMHRSGSAFALVIWSRLTPRDRRESIDRW